MVGDGVNDAIALKAAFVGIAVQGSVEVSLRAADVYLTKSGVSHIYSLIKGANYIFKIIYRNLAFSAVYNILGVYLAFTGQVSPLVAAVLMPLSSITILLSTVLSTNRLNKIIKI
jgi:P-type E1-E2 ATPase